MLPTFVHSCSDKFAAPHPLQYLSDTGHLERVVWYLGVLFGIPRELQTFSCMVSCLESAINYRYSNFLSLACRHLYFLPRRRWVIYSQSAHAQHQHRLNVTGNWRNWWPDITGFYKICSPCFYLLICCLFWLAALGFNFVKKNWNLTIPTVQ